MFETDDLWADVRGGRGAAPGCRRCKEERDAVVDMVAGEAWRPGVVVAVWRCPECSREVVREEGGERWV